MPVSRQQTEGSLRRKFDYLVTSLTDAELEHLAGHWSAVEGVLRETVKASIVTRPVHDASGWHEEAC